MSRHAVIITIAAAFFVAPAQAGNVRYAIAGASSAAEAELNARAIVNGHHMSANSVALASATQSLSSRDACNMAGLLYLPGHASADGNGCADPAAVMGPVFQWYETICNPAEAPAEWTTVCQAVCPSGWTATGNWECGQSPNSGSFWNAGAPPAGCNGCTWGGATGFWAGQVSCQVNWQNQDTGRLARSKILCEQN